MRTGRITASKLKAVRCTEPAMPAVSLIMSIRYPELSKLSSGDVSMAREKYKTMYHNTKSIDMDTLEVVEGAQHSPLR